MDPGPQHYTPGCFVCLATPSRPPQCCLKIHGVTHCACDTRCPQSPACCVCIMYTPFDVAGPDCEAQLENRKSTLWRPCAQNRPYVPACESTRQPCKGFSVPPMSVRSHPKTVRRELDCSGRENRTFVPALFIRRGGHFRLRFLPWKELCSGSPAQERPSRIFHCPFFFEPAVLVRCGSQVNRRGQAAAPQLLGYMHSLEVQVACQLDRDDGAQ